MKVLTWDIHKTVIYYIASHHTSSTYEFLLPLWYLTHLESTLYLYKYSVDHVIWNFVASGKYKMNITFCNSLPYDITCYVVKMTTAVDNIRWMNVDGIENEGVDLGHTQNCHLLHSITSHFFDLRILITPLISSNSSHTLTVNGYRLHTSRKHIIFV
jgi:hypothetical protein